MLGFSRVSSSLVCLALGACSAPSAADTFVSLESERGLLEAEVRVETPVARGDNQLFVTLRPHAEHGVARLLAVDASMAAHAHQAHAQTIDESVDGFHVSELDLFMTGRWLVVLELLVEGQSDSVSLPVDVP